jgi:branched-chain amino acid transport system permease protein
MDTFILIAVTGIGLGALYFLVACGLTLIYGLMGVLNFAHGIFLTVGAFVGLWAANTFFKNGSTIDYLLSALVGGIGAGLFALLMEQLVITRLYDRHIDQALVTVGVALVVGAMLSGWFTNDMRMLPSPAWFMDAVQVGSANIPKDRFMYIAVALFLLILFIVILRYTRIGRLAFSTVFFLGGLAAGIGGVLIATYQGGVTPLMAGSWLIYGFIVVVIGGMGSIGGSAIAALMIGVIKQFANYYVPGLGDFVIVFLLAVVLLIRPQGLLGKVNA